MNWLDYMFCALDYLKNNFQFLQISDFTNSLNRKIDNPESKMPLRTTNKNSILIAISCMFMVIQLSYCISKTQLHKISLDHESSVHHKQLRVHQFSPSVSTQLSNSIRQKIITNLDKFTDQQFALQLKQDLNTQKDEKRKLKQISPQSAKQLFAIFGITDVTCDKNGDGIITKEQLQCLNYIWKYYVPQDSSQ